MHRPNRTFLAAALLLPLAGCILIPVAAVGAAVFGTVSYENNEASVDFHADLQKVFDACLLSMQDLGYSVSTKQKPGVTEGVIDSGPAKVTVERHPGDYTRVIVRVGTFDTDDNRRRATLLVETIKRRLGE